MADRVRTPQTLDRALRLLIELSRRRNMGWRLSDLARECRLDLATASRLLGGLAAHGLVARRGTDRHFIVGPELLNLGFAADYHTDFVRAAEAVARDVALETRQVAFVFLLSGNDFVCVARSGRTGLKALGIQVGTRRALMLSAGGVAILLALPAAVRNAMIEENRLRIARAKDERGAGMERMLRRSTRLRYALNRDDVVPGITAIGTGVALPEPWRAASVLVAGPSESLDKRAIRRIASVLERAGEALHAACIAPG
jgi:DNA-binding IclR family transcriptional regulator